MTAQPAIPAGLAPLHDAALPHDTPGAWIRAAIERLAELDEEARP